jgi:hypothetical protein
MQKEQLNGLESTIIDKCDAIKCDAIKGDLSMKLMCRFILSIALLLAWVAISAAGPIYYIETATATGSLGGVSFTNAIITITVTADTSAVLGGGTFFSNLGPTTVNVSGLGTAAFTDSVGAFDNGVPLPAGTAPWAGVYDQTMSWYVVLVTANQAFLSYDLKSQIGPISGEAVFNPGTAFPTSSGDLVLTSISDNTSTFTATNTAVPEPSLILLLGLGFGAVIIAARQRN